MPTRTSRFGEDGQRAHPLKKLSKFLCKEEGNVESALVLIPMLILFLIGIQIVVATNFRNADIAIAQGEAAQRAITQHYKSGDQLIEIGGRIEKIRVLVTHRARMIPILVPGLSSLMGREPKTDVMGIAVVEPVNP